MLKVLKDFEYESEKTDDDGEEVGVDAEEAVVAF